jgi:antitoxin (DNA-binding transcriptional repressor) of toxin-antitoxin stability system
MAKKTIDVRELQETLNSSLEEVRQGTILDITDMGRPVARFMPVAIDLENRVQQMLDAGTASWSGQKPSFDIPRVPLEGSKLVSDLLLADRR